jgi:predicted CXXCH cytochrome family protein
MKYKPLFAYSLFFLLLVVLVTLQLPVYAVENPPNPTVISTRPLAGEQQVDNRTSISITFDRDMNSASFTPATVFIMDSKQNKVNILSMNYDGATKQLLLIPATPLKLNTDYTVVLTTDITDISNIPLLENYQLVFKTAAFVSTESTLPKVVAAMTPSPGDLSVGIKNVIFVSFNRAMKWETINTNTFVLKEWSGSQWNPVTETVVNDGVEFTSKLNLTSLKTNTKYQVTLTNGVEASDGTIITDDYSWEFMTGTADYYNPHGNYTTTNSAACKTCHKTHTAEGKALQSQSTQTQLCFTCHDGSGSSIDVKNEMTSESQVTFHPIKDTGNMNVGEALQCSDCHNSHEIPNGQVKNVTGVDINYTGVTWDNWNPSGGSPQLTPIKRVNTEYELCFKCHSSSTTNSAVPAKEFNPNNASYHAVVGQSKVITFQASDSSQHYYGSYVTGYNATMKLSCNNCHKSHASPNLNLLTNPEESSCYNCHQSSFYNGADSGSDLVRSAFSSSLQSQYQFNLHAVPGHAQTQNGCMSCHSSVPHGFKREGMIVLESDEFPYNMGSQIQLDSPLAPTGNWSKASCNTTCHSPEA